MLNFIFFSEDFDYLKKYLSEMALPERSCAIVDWSSGGQVYLDYINMNEVVQGVLEVPINGFVNIFTISFILIKKHILSNK